MATPRKKTTTKTKATAKPRAARGAKPAPGKESPCRCNEEFDAQGAYKTLARDVARIIDLLPELVGGGHGAPRFDAPMGGGARAMFSAAPIEREPATAALSSILRIVGGRETTRFLACCCIGNETSWFCTGILIRPDWVLTAAHCETNITRVFVGGTDIARLDGGEVIAVRKVTRHPQYNPSTQKNDLSLLRLATASTLASPVTLATADELATALACTLVGFGYNDANREMGFGTKREVEVGFTAVRTTAGQDLTAEEAQYGFFSATELVAGRKQLGRDSCNGDSGGPALIQIDDGYKLAGITSRATRDAVNRCGDGGIYVRPDAYADWIRSVIGN